MKRIKRVPVVCPFCGMGCKFELIVANGQIEGMDFIPEHPVSCGSICLKGSASLDIIRHPERLQAPLLRQNGRFLEINWNDALEFATQKLLNLKRKYGPESVAFLASAKATNEENYLFQKLARLFGSPHIDHCARLCHAPSLIGLMNTLGSGAQTNPVSDIKNSKCILIIGSNFAENHPVVTRWVLDAKDSGAFVIVIDPRHTPTTEIANLHIQPIPGTDHMLLQAMMGIIIQEGLANFDFINRRTLGFKDFVESLSHIDLRHIAEQAKVEISDLFTSARFYARSTASCIIYCMGITQHSRGTENVYSCVNLSLLCGHIGKRGTGIYPLRGQNNVQGACDMGCLADFYPGYIKISDETSRPDKNGHAYPLKVGFTVGELAGAIENEKIKALVIMGENPLVSDPDSGRLKRAFEKLDFIMISEIFMTETAEVADLVLPSACWAEKDGSYTNTERRVQWSNKAVEPINGAREDLWIISELGRKLGLWKKNHTAEDVLSEINKMVPQYGGITPDKLKENKEGIFWPCPEENHPGTSVLYEDKFLTSDGKARFYCFSEPDRGLSKHEERFPYHVITGRVVEHYNSGSITRRLQPLHKYKPYAQLHINPKDASQLGVKDRDTVRVISHEGEIELPVTLDNNLKEGCFFVPFHFPGINYLTPNTLDKESKVPGFKDARCVLKRRQ